MFFLNCGLNMHIKTSIMTKILQCYQIMFIRVKHDQLKVIDYDYHRSFLFDYVLNNLIDSFCITVLSQG